MTWEPITEEKFDDLLGAVPTAYLERQGQNMAFACGEPTGYGRNDFTYDFCMFYKGEYFKCEMQLDEFDFQRAAQEIDLLLQE